MTTGNDITIDEKARAILDKCKEHIFCSSCPLYELDEYERQLPCVVNLGYVDDKSEIREDVTYGSIEKAYELMVKQASEVPNQQAKADSGKPQITLVPRKIFWDVARIRMYGNQKYGDPENWRTVEIERYRDALMRHLLLYLDDPKSVDSESGYPHLWHAACNMAFLCEMEDLSEYED